LLAEEDPTRKKIGISPQTAGREIMRDPLPDMGTSPRQTEKNILPRDMEKKRKKKKKKKKKAIFQTSISCLFLGTTMIQVDANWLR